MNVKTTPLEVMMVDAHLQFSLDIKDGGEGWREQYKLVPINTTDIPNTVAWAVIEGVVNNKVTAGILRVVPINPYSLEAFSPQQRAGWPDIARFFNNWMSHLGGAGFTITGFTETESGARNWVRSISPFAGTDTPVL